MKLKPAPTLFLSLVALAFPLSGAPAATAASRPNMLFILLDDQRWDDLGYAGHPFVKTPNIDRIAAEGARFTQAFVTTPLCSPSRASFLTGQYTRHHGILENTARDALSHQLVTFPRLLHDSGYETGFVGKWHMGLDDNARPGFDYWVSVKGQGNYLDPELNDNGVRKTKRGYVTDIFSDYAVDFLKRKHRQPFLLFLAHKAVHPDLVQRADGSLSDPSAGKFIPAPRHQHLYANAPIPRRANFGVTPTDKLALARQIPGLPALGPNTGTDDETIRNRLRMLAAVDEGIGRILKLLEQMGQLENTVVVFTSDEGYFYGEHGLSVERRLAYEESARIPLAIRWPGLIRRGTVIDELVLNIDLAPTLLELGGATTPGNVDGRSFVPFLRGEQIAWRESFVIETFSDKVFPRVAGMGYQALRTTRWKYIQYVDRPRMDELYDLKGDPFELTNLVHCASAQPNLATLRQELQTWRAAGAGPERR